jgi:hypothetical protein
MFARRLLLVIHKACRDGGASTRRLGVSRIAGFLLEFFEFDDASVFDAVDCFLVYSCADEIIGDDVLGRGIEFYFVVADVS